MNKFTNLQKKDTKVEPEKVVYKGKYTNIINVNDWDVIVQSDSVVILPYIKDEGYVLLRSEYIPTYAYKNKHDIDNSRYLTVISGTIEQGETPKAALRRELYEEAGVVVSEFYEFDIEGPFFVSKGNSNQYYCCIMELTYNEYKMVASVGDGTKEEQMSRTIKVSLGDLDEIKVNDMVTQYMISKLKTEYLKK